MQGYDDDQTFNPNLKPENNSEASHASLLKCYYCFLPRLIVKVHKESLMAMRTFWEALLSGRVRQGGLPWPLGYGRRCSGMSTSPLS